MKFLAFFVLLVASTSVYGAEASFKSEFTVNAQYEKTVNFVKKNPAQLRRAAGLEVLQDLGNGKLKVQHETPKGVFVWVLQESIEEKDGLYRYQTYLVESIQGGIESSNTDLILQVNRDHVSVSSSSSAVVNNGRVRSADIRIDLSKSTRRVERLLQSNLEKDYPNLIPKE